MLTVDSADAVLLLMKCGLLFHDIAEAFTGGMPEVSVFWEEEVRDDRHFMVALLARCQTAGPAPVH